MNWRKAETATGREGIVLVWVEPDAPPLAHLKGYFCAARLWDGEVWIKDYGLSLDRNGWRVTHWTTIDRPST